MNISGWLRVCAWWRILLLFELMMGCSERYAYVVCRVGGWVGEWVGESGFD